MRAASTYILAAALVPQGLPGFVVFGVEFEPALFPARRRIAAKSPGDAVAAGVGGGERIRVSNSRVSSALSPTSTRRPFSSMVWRVVKNSSEAGLARCRALDPSKRPFKICVIEIPDKNAQLQTVDTKKVVTPSKRWRLKSVPAYPASVRSR
jgi:hypothetical protein